MRKLFLILFFGIITVTNCKSQDTTERKIIDTIFVEYAKWPYLNGSIPKHIGVTGGFEGFKKECFELGICYSVWDINAYGDIFSTSHVGLNLIYKQNVINNNVKSFELEFGMFTGLIMALNLNYNILPTNNFYGFKPFIGITFLNLEFFYGYNFYKNRNDPEALINHNRFTARLYIPTFKLTRKKGNDQFVYEERKFE